MANPLKALIIIVIIQLVILFTKAQLSFPSTLIKICEILIRGKTSFGVNAKKLVFCQIKGNAGVPAKVRKLPVVVTKNMLS